MVSTAAWILYYDNRPTYIHAGMFAPFASFLEDHGGRRLSAKKGDVLWGPDTNIDHVYYCCSGIARTTFTHENGYRKILSFHTAGDVFPGASITRFRLEHSLGIEALTDMQLMVFDVDTFRDLMHRNLDLYDTMFEWYAREINRLLYESAHQEYNPTITKVANLLLLFSDSGLTGKIGEVALSQEDLAEILCINRVNIAKHLCLLRDEGVIETKRSCILIKDREKLLSFCTQETTP